MGSFSGQDCNLIDQYDIRSAIASDLWDRLQRAFASDPIESQKTEETEVGSTRKDGKSGIIHNNTINLYYKLM